jgi:hypothetical protein
VKVTGAGPHAGPHEESGPFVHTGHRLCLAATCKRDHAKAMCLLGLPIEISINNCAASSCFPYKSGFILSTVATAIHSCSAVTTSATRWTAPPP